MTLRLSSWIVSLLLAGAAPSWGAAPNILLFLADDLGWRDLGFSGSRFYLTPHLDALARESLQFTQAYAAAPVCTPTRAALLTGKSPARLNLTAVFDRDFGREPLLPPVWQRNLPLEEVTLAERLRVRGYTTVMIGKWHLGYSEEFWPEHQGFDVNLGGWSSGRPESYFVPYENPRLPDGPPGEHLTDRLAAEAEKFLMARTQRPFFLYLAFHSPHTPLEAPPATVQRFRDREPDGGQRDPVYAAMIAHLDAAVGRVLAALETAGLADNTIVIFTSDNGGVHTVGDLPVTDNAPLRSEKFHLYEGGLRVPLLVRWPGRIAPGATTQLAITTDLPVTLLALTGAPSGEVGTTDGISLEPVLRNGESARFDRDLAWHYPHYMPRQAMRPASAYRSGDHKLVFWHEDRRLELYDLAADPSESHDLAPSDPARALELYDALEAWWRHTDARLPRPNPAYRPESVR